MAKEKTSTLRDKISCIFSSVVKVEPRKILGKEYQTFEGDSYRNLMPQLIGAGLTPMSVSDIMRARLRSYSPFTNYMDRFWRDHYFDTIDGVAYYGNKVKIVHDAQPLKDIKPNTQLRDGALTLTPEQYQTLEGVESLILTQEQYITLEGEEFLRNDLEKAKARINVRLRKSEVLSHPVWRALARYDHHLLKEYANAVFAMLEKFGSDEAMAIYLGHEQETPIMRAWFLNLIFARSDASGLESLLGDHARLVGTRGKVRKKGR